LQQLAEYVAEVLDIGPGTRVFEVDCGNGQFLFPLYSNGYIVGGTDGDPAAIQHALEAMPEGLFTAGMASALDPATPWDVVVCRSFSGAPDLDYMRGLVARMFAKATHAIALVNVPEKSHQALMHALAEVGAKAIQIEGNHLFARV
jgi:trans-aconitate methyltransferase